MALRADTSTCRLAWQACCNVLRPADCAEFVELLAGQRVLLHGLDALQDSSGLVPRCPCGPERARATCFQRRTLKRMRSVPDSIIRPWRLLDLGSRLPELGAVDLSVPRKLVGAQGASNDLHGHLPN